MDEAVKKINMIGHEKQKPFKKKHFEPLALDMDTFTIRTQLEQEHEEKEQAAEFER